MYKLLAKILDDRQKILHYDAFEFDDYFDKENLYQNLQEICYKYKIETPIVLNKHKNALEEFGYTKFMKDDFVDSIDFRALVIELVE